MPVAHPRAPTKSLGVIVALAAHGLVCGVTGLWARDGYVATFVGVKVDRAPSLDGVVDQTTWRAASECTVPLISSSVIGRGPGEAKLRGVYTESHVFFLVQWKGAPLPTSGWWGKRDGNEPRAPKGKMVVSLLLDMAGSYPLLLKRGGTYRADVWSWDSSAASHTTFGEDRMLILSDRRFSEAALRYRGGGPLSRKLWYEHRLDAGIPGRPVGEAASEAAGTHQRAFGSVADVHGAGRWRDGVWTVEMGRKLRTDHPDDLQFGQRDVHTITVEISKVGKKRPAWTCHSDPVGMGFVLGARRWTFDVAGPNAQVGDFDPVSGTWIVASTHDAPSPPAVYRQFASRPAGAGGAKAVCNYGLQSRFRLTTRLCVRSAIRSMSAGVLFRYWGPHDHYLCTVNFPQRVLTIVRYVAGKPHLLDRVYLKPDELLWHTLTLEDWGTVMSARIDRQEPLIVHDVPPGNGRIGLWTSRDARTDFDNVHFEPLRVPLGDE